MNVMDTSCLVSTLRNSSNATRRYAFLPPHGRELAANEEVNVWGDIREAILRGLAGPRNVKSFLEALRRDLIEIVSTPAPVVYDETAAVTKIMGVNNSLLAVSDPCWEGSVTGDTAAEELAVYNPIPVT